ncbi:MAG: LytR C-terminal domain-containing protein [Candidatus Shapirobacteria bacterium]|nr:LytR C-terminal domain-containing protein [Candidatus Shapirobacteria bacterium]
MSLFSRPRVVLWPKSDSLEIYLDQSNNNSLTLKINLWGKCTDSEIQSLNTYLNQNKIEHCQILIPDDVVFTKSFTYDSKIDTIDKNEVIGLAESFVHFKINPDYLEYKLLPADDKTIIQANIYDPAKFNLLKANLALTSLKNYSVIPVSSAITRIMPSLYDKEFFLLYPLNELESTLILSKQGIVYLTANFKTNALDIQKIINYSKLYFTENVNKLFYADTQELSIVTTSELDKTAYNQTQIAGLFHLPSNFPVPVIGLLADKISKVAIINTSMENKKNIFPLIAVFVVAMAIASVVIWYVLSHNDNSITNPSTGTAATPTTEVVPTAELSPTPSATDISKTLKIQVLNATDINGQAATLKEKLITLGFTSVTVGNSTTNATANVVQVKPTLTATVSAYFQSNLSSLFTDFTTADLKANSTYDVVFVIGTKLGNLSSTTTTTPVPTKKVTPTPTIKTTPTPTITP